MTIKNLLQNREFKDKHILKLIISNVFWMSKIDIYTKRDRKISTEKLSKIKGLYQKYEKEKIPIEYILWETEFAGRKFKVNSNVLIPRPETEYLVYYVKKVLLENKDYEVFDIWTWSWIIWNSISSHLSKKVICSDISEEALNVARENDQSWINEFIISNLWEHLDNYWDNLLICANLPYLKSNYKLDDYTKKEPYIALFAGEDWLCLYKKLLNQVKQLKKKKIICFFELTKEEWFILNRDFRLNWGLLDTCHENIKILRFEV